jgi:hypothetical protein
MMPTPQRRAFASIITARTGDEILIPRIRALLTNPSLKAFGIKMPPMSPRAPDGWFHPSTHPGWPERMLTYYLMAHRLSGVVSVASQQSQEPLELVDEDKDLTGLFAIYQGHWLHGFTQHVLLQGNLLQVINPKGRTSADKVERPLVDPVLRSRGHIDGMLDIEHCRLEAPTGLELKSMNSFKLSKCPKGPARDRARLEWLKESNYGYYLQAQEYMRLGAYGEQRMLLIAPAYPFDMVEIAIPYDAPVAEATALKYARVLDHYLSGTLPDPCCAVGSPQASSCPARRVCPIGRMSA